MSSETPIKCPDALLPDGPTCPRCGGPRAASGVDGGSWVHFPRPAASPGGQAPPTTTFTPAMEAQSNRVPYAVPSSLAEPGDGDAPSTIRLRAESMIALRADARLGAALREALATTVDGEQSLVVTRRDAWITDFRQRAGLPIPDNDATRKLSDLLRAPARDATGGET